MSKTEKQQEKIANLLKLINENPELEILPMVDTECVQSDDYSRYMSAWGNAKIDYYYCQDERIYFKYHDFDELFDGMLDGLADEECKGMSDDQMGKLAEQKVDNLPWEKAIIVSIDPY